MKRAALSAMLFALAALSPFAAPAGPLEKWAAAVGGRDRIATIHAMYREATIEVSGFRGSIKAWHSSDGRYRKEEQVATFGSIETFDGTNGCVRQGGEMRCAEGAELQRIRSTAFANSNAMFFAFFPERHFGTIAFEDDGWIVLKRDGGIEWRVQLDPETWRPKTMVHKEGPRTVEVTFVSYETVEGVSLESEIRRTNGDPRFDAVITFTKTVINPPIDDAMFSKP